MKKTNTSKLLNWLVRTIENDAYCHHHMMNDNISSKTLYEYYMRTKKDDDPSISTERNFTRIMLDVEVYAPDMIISYNNRCTTIENDKKRIRKRNYSYKLINSNNIISYNLRDNKSPPPCPPSPPQIKRLNTTQQISYECNNNKQINNCDSTSHCSSAHCSLLQNQQHSDAPPTSTTTPTSIDHYIPTGDDYCSAPTNQHSNKDQLQMLYNVSTILLTPVINDHPAPPELPLPLPPSLDPVNFAPLTQQYIDRASLLYFTTTPRFHPDHIGQKISINKNPWTTEYTKWRVLTKAIQLRVNTYGYTIKQKKELVDAIMKTESYLAGYPKHFGSWNSFVRWYAMYEKEEDACYDPGVSFFHSDIGNNIEPYTDLIERKFPRLLHDLYRYSVNIVGLDANIDTIVENMNQKASIDYPHCPIRHTLHLNHYHFMRFFNSWTG